ncbi:Glucose-methanol-choline oxidoreductase family protein [Prunus dulcis]|uniref:Glucose-methanol-choline oxidoreductase family protein n=1 Tax=Prunus dulcis TaxID=3755 RepID=A0A4Y1R4B0_PRUDU|nr:Glucose-methanol-choline oxidoreductase family protein [Prunus dulcis]
MGKKTKKSGKGKEKATKAEENRAHTERHQKLSPEDDIDAILTIWHYHGGCQIGRVVDKGYRVPAIDSLRVIDGSTFYHTPGANPQATHDAWKASTWGKGFCMTD